MKKTQSVHDDQRGIVAIMVTMVMLLVISLTVLTFAKIIRREQRQTLDRQLSTQALYAAESGVHLAAQALRDNSTSVALRTALSNKTSCSPTGDATFDANMTLDSGVGVSCLTTNSLPTSQEYKNISAESKVIPVAGAGGATVSSITIDWKDSGGSGAAVTNCPDGSNTNLTSSPTAPLPLTPWTCPVGILRVDIVPTNGPIGRQNLTDTMFTFFAYPAQAGATNITYLAGAANQPNQGQIFKTICSGSPVSCSVNIVGLNANSHHLKVRTIYGNSTVTVTAKDAGGTILQQVNGQVIIDSTGKAQDVLRRVQVRVSLATISALDLPEYAVQASEGLCKRLTISGATATADGGIDDPNNICSRL